MIRCEQMNNESAQSSNESFSKEFWDFLWFMNIKNKYKYFI